MTKLFFGKEQQHRKTKNQTGNLLCEAAFGLLQWAQHGEPYEFGTTVVDETAESSEDDEEQLLLDDTQETLVQGESEQDQEQMIKFEDNSSGGNGSGGMQCYARSSSEMLNLLPTC